MKIFNLKLITVSVIALTIFSSAQAETQVDREEGSLFNSYVSVELIRPKIPAEGKMTVNPSTEDPQELAEFRIAAQDQDKALANQKAHEDTGCSLDPSLQLGLTALKAVGTGGYFVAKLAASLTVNYVLPGAVSATKIAAKAAYNYGPTVLKAVGKGGYFAAKWTALFAANYVLPGTVSATKVAANAACTYGPKVAKGAFSAGKSAFSAGRSIYNWVTKKNQPDTAALLTQLINLGEDDLRNIEMKELQDGDSQTKRTREKNRDMTDEVAVDPKESPLSILS